MFYSIHCTCAVRGGATPFPVVLTSDRFVSLKHVSPMARKGDVMWISVHDAILVAILWLAWVFTVYRWWVKMEDLLIINGNYEYSHQTEVYQMRHRCLTLAEDTQIKIFSLSMFPCTLRLISFPPKRERDLREFARGGGEKLSGNTPQIVKIKKRHISAMQKERPRREAW